MDIVLIAGLWLPATVWTDTAHALESNGHRAIAVELPGADDGSRTASLDDQIRAVLEAVDAADRPLVVGHSAASTLAWIVADRRSESIAGVVMIGGFPAEPASTYAAFFDVEQGVMPFPGWEPFEGPDSVDLDDAARARLAGAAIAVPEAVALGRVEYHDERRWSVALTIVCPEFTPDDLTAWMNNGDNPELERVAQLDLVDIDSGHWPMVTRPTDLATLIGVAAERSTVGGDAS